MFRQYKIKKCYVLLCPLNNLKNKISNNRKKVTDREYINQFGLKQCFVLIKKPQKVPIERYGKVVFVKSQRVPIERPEKEFTTHYSHDFLQKVANYVFLANKGKKCVNFTRLYNKLYTPFWNLDYNGFLSLLYKFYEELCMKNKWEHNKIKIVIDANNADVNNADVNNAVNTRVPPKCRKCRLKIFTKSTRDFLEMRKKRPGNLDYQDTKLPEEISKSPDKVQVLSSTSGPAPELLQEQQGGIKVDQHLLEMKSKAPTLKILPEQIETEDPLLELEGREPVVRILQEQTSQESVQSLSEIKEKEPTLEILIDQPSKECVKAGNPLPETEVKESAMEILQELPPLEDVIANQLLPKVKEEEPVLEVLQELIKEDNSLPEVEVRVHAIEILQEHPPQGNVEADQPSPELRGKELPLELLQKQLLREEIDDKSLSEIEKESPLKMLQEQSEQESIKAVLSLPKIEEKKPGLEMLQGQFLLEKVKASQHLLVRTEDLPVLELMETGERKRKYSSESPTLRKKQILREVVQKPEVIEKKQLADQIEDEPLIVESRPRKFARMQRQQELERMGIPPILHQLEDLDLIRRPQFLHPPCLQRQTVHPNFVSSTTMQYTGPVRYEVVNAIPSNSDSSNRTNLSDLDEKSIKNHNGTSDQMEKPNKVNGHYTDSDHTEMSDQVEVPDTVGEDMRNRKWSNSIIKSTEAEQSRRSSVIKQTVKSNNNIGTLATKVL
ncbi:hypothetical protein TNCT_234051 [Trichonephila clavata]|uniref:Uncharacterized protein n=1 Tax=Trichonephila clavata TaxID=2740835 RepID=A0A8X6H0Q4_TRICU|nr:hypothetical protein TNCT_234051 [Trichonephila clavata]